MDSLGALTYTSFGKSKIFSKKVLTESYGYCIMTIEDKSESDAERSTDMKYKTIEDIRENVRELANVHGFEVEDCKWTALGITIKTNSDYVRIDISSDIHMNFEEGVVIQNFEFCPTICRMGGHNTSEELRTIADDVQRIADLIDALSLRGGYTLVVEMS